MPPAEKHTGTSLNPSLTLAPGPGASVFHFPSLKPGTGGMRIIATSESEHRGGILTHNDKLMNV